MTPTTIEIEPFRSDPKMAVGEFLMLEHSDVVASVWQQRFVCTSAHNGKYVFSPVDAWGKPSS